MRGIRRGQKGITTVQTVISGVSFLAVAGGFASAVVSAGMDASQESEQAVHEAIQNIQGTYQIKGPVIAKATTVGSSGTIGQITFTVALAGRGGIVDFTPPVPDAANNGIAGAGSQNPIVISYSDKYQHIENLYWTIARLGRNNGDNLLEDGELFQITIGGGLVPGQTGGNLIDALPAKLSTDTSFTIEMKGARGATLSFERRTPSSIDRIVNFRY